MSKAKHAASNADQQASSSSSGSFAQGFLLGQLTLALIIFFFINFFLFGDSPSADTRAVARAAARRRRTLSHSASLRRKRSSATLGARHISTGSSAAHVLTTEKILEKTYYNVDGHQPESLDWFNVLIAQTIAQLRAEALDDDAILSSLTKVLNGPGRPDFLDEIRVTEISLGEEFPIFSNCRVIPVDEDGTVVKPVRGRKGAQAGNLNASRLQARMDVDLSDVVTLGIETKLVLNYPKPFVAALPVALSVSVVRFSGTLSVSFTPSQAPTTSTTPEAPSQGQNSSIPQPTHSPTTLTFTFLDDYRLDLSVHSLIGSRSRLQDVPKIAQLVEQRLHAWFDERCVEPRFQQIVLPSLWPRKRNVRGGGPDEDRDDEEALDTSVVDEIERENARRDKGKSSGVDINGVGSSVRGQTSASPLASPSSPRISKRDGSTSQNFNHETRPRLQKRSSAAVMMSDEEEDSLAEAGAELREADRRERIREAARSREREAERNIERDRIRERAKA